MTVKLLMDWPDSRDGKQYVAGNLLTTDAATEAGLVAAKMATTTLTGGTAYVAPVAQKQRYDVQGEFDPLTGGGVFSGGGRDLIVISSTAPSNADGRPDGTVYIQTA